MSKEALAPCLVCGKVLDNAMSEAINQPHDADCFETYGHYGSTDFDPMNGEYLEINVCTECMSEAAAKDRVLIGRSRKPVMVLGVIVGWTNARRELVPWRPDMKPEDERFNIETFDEWEACKDRVELNGRDKEGAERYVIESLTAYAKKHGLSVTDQLIEDAGTRVASDG